MNRYDVASVAKFNPLSYQEIMAAPLAMRQKHDASIAQAEAMRIQANPYSKHYNRALELKQQMDNEIAKNVDTLNKEGYNPTTFQNITKLNRQYQDMVSPTGEIGQINAENINIKKINEEYDKLGKEKNWGQETVDYWKNKALKEYNEKPLYDANGRILTYSGPEGVVNKVDYNKRLHELASSAKMSISDFSNAVTKLGMDEKSGYNVANKNSEAHKLGDNYAGVKAAYDTLKREMYDPTSEVHKSMRYEGRDPQSLLDILNTQSNIYRQNVKSDEYSKDINPFGDGPGSSEGSDGSGNMDIIDTQHALKIDKFTNRSHGTNVLELNKLESKIKNKTATQQDQIEYNSLQKFVNQTQTKVGSNPQYKEEKALEDKYKNELVNKSSSKMRATYNAIKNGTLNGVYKVSGNTATVDPVKLKQQGYTLSEISEIKEVANKFLNNPHTKNITKIFSETNKLNNNYANYYNLFPNNSKGTKAYEDFNKNMESIFSGGTANTLQNLGLISAIQIDGANEYDINDDDRNGIQNLLSNDIKPGSFNISGFSDNNVTGLPSIRMSFNTKDSSKGYKKGNYSWKDNKTIGQEGSKVSFDLDFKKLSNIPDNANKLQTMNALGKLAEFIYNNGGENGQNISKKILQTISENK